MVSGEKIDMSMAGDHTVNGDEGGVHGDEWAAGAAES